MNAEACRTGCCGWREARAKYFERFRAVELQDTFYEPPSIGLARKWGEAAPPSFEFCIKAWQLITHKASSPTYRRLKSKLSPQEKDFTGSFQATEQVWLAWERTLEIARVLNARAIVFQCPKSFDPVRENVRNFRTFFSQVERGGIQLAWEPRGAWRDDLVRELCEEFNLLHCVDPFDRPSVYGETFYWRLHGRGGYSYRYSEQELDELGIMLRKGAEEGRTGAYVMFNNIWMKEDAARFQQRLGSYLDAKKS